MMGPGFGEQLAADFFKGLLVALFISFFLGVGACWLLPKAWAWVRPLIHAWTAA